jgi:hypothetical protein
MKWLFAAAAAVVLFLPSFAQAADLEALAHRYGYERIHRHGGNEFNYSGGYNGGYQEQYGYQQQDCADCAPRERVMYVQDTVRVVHVPRYVHEYVQASCCGEQSYQQGYEGYGASYSGGCPSYGASYADYGYDTPSYGGFGIGIGFRGGFHHGFGHHRFVMHVGHTHTRLASSNHRHHRA